MRQRNRDFLKGGELVKEVREVREQLEHEYCEELERRGIRNSSCEKGKDQK